MSKTALMFAGQGAQVVGMGKDLAEAYPRRGMVRPRQRRAGLRPGLRLFRGPGSRVDQDRERPAGHLPGELGRFPTAQGTGSRPDVQATAGLSLGEFTALTAAGAMGFEDGLRVVRQRGRFMQEACDATHGGMAAVIGLEEAPAREVCAQAGVVLANLNCPGQLVISGETERIIQACDLAKARGARRALPLPVAGAYHSPLMASAQPKLQAELARISWSTGSAGRLQCHRQTTRRAGRHPSAAGGTGDRVRALGGIHALLAGQGFTRFIELGPGAALSGFMKRIDKTAQMLNVADVPSLEATVTALKGGA